MDTETKNVFDEASKGLDASEVFVGDVNKTATAQDIFAGDADFFKSLENIRVHITFVINII